MKPLPFVPIAMLLTLALTAPCLTAQEFDAGSPGGSFHLAFSISSEGCPSFSISGGGPSLGIGTSPGIGIGATPAAPVDSTSSSDPLGSSGVPAQPSTFDPFAGLIATSGSTDQQGSTLPAVDTGQGTTEPPADSNRAVFRVKATAQGEIGSNTASGIRIAKWSEGAALPSRRGLHKAIDVTYLANGRNASCEVLDVGPWNTNDPYWEQPDGKPQAESGRDRRGRRTNRAGIDLYNATWYRLLALRAYDRRLIENTSGMVEWSFAQ